MTLMLGSAGLRSLFSRSGGIPRGFSNRNFRPWTSGNVFSLIGPWIQRVAVGWLTWALTHSGAWLGLIAAAEFLPSIFAGPLGGAVADRVDKINLTRICQILLAVQTVAIGVLARADTITSRILLLPPSC